MIIGIDPSLSKTGLAVLEKGTGNLIAFNSLSKTDGLYSTRVSYIGHTAADYIENTIKIQRRGITAVFQEMPFRGGFSVPELYMLGGVILNSITQREGIKNYFGVNGGYYFLVNTAIRKSFLGKKSLGKRDISQLISSWYGKKINNDEADAIIIALAGGIKCGFIDIEAFVSRVRMFDSDWADNIIKFNLKDLKSIKRI